MTGRMGRLYIVPKKCNLSNCDNWRGITLLPTPSKVYCQMILSHMHDMIDAQLGKEQVEFGPKQSCTK